MWRQTSWLQDQTMEGWQSGTWLIANSSTCSWDTEVCPLSCLSYTIHSAAWGHFLFCFIPEGAIRDIKVMDGSTHCLSLADDCSLRRWSLVSGQELLCIHNVLDSAPSSSHLHLFEQKRLLFVCSSTQVPPSLPPSLLPQLPPQLPSLLLQPPLKLPPQLPAQIATITPTTTAITLGLLSQGS